VLAHFAKELERVVRERYENNQTRAAKALDCTQGHISAMLLGNRGPGLNTLMAMRDITGRSIDSLLGLSPTPADNVIAQLRQTLELDLDTRLRVKQAQLEAMTEAERRELREKLKQIEERERKAKEDNDG
jgi:transcriptional regulator with XRE-family HTH domain